jgi:acyl-CoA thioesterase-1
MIWFHFLDRNFSSETVKQKSAKQTLSHSIKTKGMQVVKMKTKTKRLFIVVVAVLLVALSLIVVFSDNPATYSVSGNKLSRIACLGDSITNITGYPEELQTLLGNDSVVGNFGVSGATVNLNSNKPYYYDLTYRDARNFLPTTVIIMLGTNDARTDNYLKINTFIANYERMVNRTQRWNTTQQIFLIIPPPIFNNTLDLNSTSYSDGVIPRIKQVANDSGLPIIDVYTPLINHPEYFPDGVHPNSWAVRVIVDTIYQALTSNSKGS